MPGSERGRQGAGGGAADKAGRAADSGPSGGRQDGVISFHVRVLHGCNGLQTLAFSQIRQMYGRSLSDVRHLLRRISDRYMTDTGR
jgi:hypothetical protein